MILLYLLYSAVICAAIALPVRELLLSGIPDSGTLIRSGALLLIGILGLSRTRRFERKQRLLRREEHRNAFAAYIGDVFPDDQNARDRFFDAVDCYARKNPAGGWKRLEKLLPLCKSESERYAVSVFSGFCLHNLEKYEAALEHYRIALSLRQDSTVASNMGVCYEKLELPDYAARYYHIAILANPDNPLPHSNLAQQCIRLGQYEKARDYARHALNINPQFPQAIAAMAICSYLLGDREVYEQYYRQAVENGYDGKKLRHYLQTRKPEC